MTVRECLTCCYVTFFSDQAFWRRSESIPIEDPSPAAESPSSQSSTLGTPLPDPTPTDPDATISWDVSPADSPKEKK